MWNRHCVQQLSAEYAVVMICMPKQLEGSFKARFATGFEPSFDCPIWNKLADSTGDFRDTE